MRPPLTSTKPSPGERVCELQPIELRNAAAIAISVIINLARMSSPPEGVIGATKGVGLDEILWRLRICISAKRNLHRITWNIARGSRRLDLQALRFAPITRPHSQYAATIRAQRLGKCFWYQETDRVIMSTVCFGSRSPCPSRG